MAKIAESRRLGLVLSGGGARGVFQVGVYERLLADPRFARGPTVLSGTSAGAINAALIAVGKTPDEMKRFWMGMADDPPVKGNEEFFQDLWRQVLRLGAGEPLHWVKARSSLLSHARRHLPPRIGSVTAWAVEVLMLVRIEFVRRLLQSVGPTSLFSTAALRQRLVEELGGERVIPHRPDIDLAVNAMDALTGRVVRYVTRRTKGMLDPDYEVVDALTVDMVTASAAIPLLFPAVKIGSHLLWDGGVLVNTPLAPVVSLGADEIVTVLVTEPTDASVTELSNLGHALERMADSFLENTYNLDRKLLLDRNRLHAHVPGDFRPVTLYEAIRPERASMFTAVSYLDFERSTMDAMYHEGLHAVDAWLARGPIVEASRRQRRYEQQLQETIERRKEKAPGPRIN